MRKNLVIILITTLTLTFNVNAETDSNLIMKNEPSEVKDCLKI